MAVEGAVYDLVVIGGGINGAGIAREAVGRGLSVLLCEQHDLASHTSSASTKLIHGGLRYLEHYEFGLVRKALQEREVLLRAAPHLIVPLRFVMPHAEHLRSAWLMRAGLFLYDRLGKRELLPASETVDLRSHPAGAPLRARSRKGYIYSDAFVDDSRLVVLTALDAALRGADILTRTRFASAARSAGYWEATLRCGSDGTQRCIRARCIVNATGPWVTDVLRGPLQIESKRQVRAAKGSHLVVPRLFDHDYAYTLQNDDRRIVFAIPYQSDYTLIGTTDVEYRGDPSDVSVSDEEVAYLCEAVNRYLAEPIAATDVAWRYSGVRALLEDETDDLSAVSRDYELELDLGGGAAPLLSVFGGKITTYRRLAEEALTLLGGPLGTSTPPWSAAAPLPGGDMPGADFGAFQADLRRRYPWLPAGLARRYARAYGTRAEKLLADARSVADLGEEIGDGLFEAEARYLAFYEWALTAEDVLWRRSKLGLRASPDTARRLDAWLSSYRGATGAGRALQCA
ncbi:MAG TPA: glycerol-3-phosphate dehydrogenase [Burkholderiales bacterium]|nr:glycerol-3-phosphate dehydrogenase [Burkholderiales bacterium]